MHPTEGQREVELEREVVVRTRVNQGLFRRMILARYHETCCVTGLAIPDLLVAGHIVPWAEAPEERLNPRNGLCLNPLHDRAFERGLMTIDDGFRIVIAERVRDDASPAAARWTRSCTGTAGARGGRARPRNAPGACAAAPGRG